MFRPHSLYHRPWVRRVAVAAAASIRFAVAGVPIVLAQTTTAPVQIPDPLGGVKDPRDLLGRIIGASLGIVGSIALLFFLWGGFLWMTSGGNAERVELGKRTIMWATLGLAVIFLAYAMIKTVLCLLTGSCGGFTSSGTGSTSGGTGSPI